MVLQDCFSGVIRVCQGSSRKIEEYFKVALSVFQGYFKKYKSVQPKFQGYLKEVSKMFRERLMSVVGKVRLD